MWESFDLKKYCRNTKNDHRKRGFKINFKMIELRALLEDLYIYGCPYCGKECTPPNGRKHQHNTFSLDVKNPQIKELIIENIQIICFECNTHKGRLSHKRYLKELEGAQYGS